MPKLDNLDKFIEADGQKDRQPYNAVIEQSAAKKNRWARGDLNSGSPPCKGGGFGAYYDEKSCSSIIQHLVDASWQPYEV